VKWFPFENKVLARHLRQSKSKEPTVFLFLMVMKPTEEASDTASSIQIEWKA
jgi:hypothetical protein